MWKCSQCQQYAADSLVKCRRCQSPRPKYELVEKPEPVADVRQDVRQEQERIASNRNKRIVTAIKQPEESEGFITSTFNTKPGFQPGRSGDWIATIDDKKFWPFDPRVGDFELDAICVALGNTCRFNGHVNRFYSVAQHSLAVAALCDDKYLLWALLHDAGEAYIGDMVRPLKKHFPKFQEIEMQILQTLGLQFGLEWPIPEIVKMADDNLLVLEATELGFDVSDWGLRPVSWDSNKLEVAREILDCNDPSQDWGLALFERIEDELKKRR